MASGNERVMTVDSGSWFELQVYLYCCSVQRVCVAARGTVHARPPRRAGAVFVQRKGLPFAVVVGGAEPAASRVATTKQNKTRLMHKLLG